MNGLDFAGQVSTRKSPVFASKRLKCQKKHLAISQVKTPFEKLTTIKFIRYLMKILQNSKATVDNLTHSKCSVSTQIAGRDTYGDVCGKYVSQLKTN